MATTVLTSERTATARSSQVEAFNMLIFLTNTPRDYAWGSTDALPQWLGTPETGKPQAELWLGSHPGAPATVAKATPNAQTVIDLIAADPEHYGVSGGNLPFLMKVLAIASPLSLQVHPNREQAEAGFGREEALGIARDDPARNYGDANHKPELLVALSEVTALCGFRSLVGARQDVVALAKLAEQTGDATGARALESFGAALTGDPEGARKAAVSWALGSRSDAIAACNAIVRLCEHFGDRILLPDANRVVALRCLAGAYPADTGILVSLLLHVVRLEPGESIFLGARQPHAYLSGLGVEIMAASDNVLRAGFTHKHIDAAELERVLDYSELEQPRFANRRVRPGVVVWEPPVSDFCLVRATLDSDSSDSMLGAGRGRDDTAPEFVLPATSPVLVLVTAGRVRVERQSDLIDEVASVRRGQCLFVSAGDPVRITGHGEVFFGTVGSSANEF